MPWHSFSIHLSLWKNTRNSSRKSKMEPWQGLSAHTSWICLQWNVYVRDCVSLVAPGMFNTALCGCLFSICFTCVRLGASVQISVQECFRLHEVTLSLLLLHLSYIALQPSFPSLFSIPLSSLCNISSPCFACHAFCCCAVSSARLWPMLLYAYAISLLMLPADSEFSPGWPSASF